MPVAELNAKAFSPPGRWRPKMGSKRWLVVPIAALLVLGGLAGILILRSSSPSGRAPTPASDGPTFYQALAEVNTSVTNTSGGPWQLFSVYGIATQAPFAAGVIGYPQNNITTNACGAAFNGLTLWNGTIPVFTGSFASGTAPFWQFAYFSASSERILLATDELGVARLFPSIAFPSSCQPWYDFSPDPANWTAMLGQLPANSPSVASSISTALTEQGVTLNGSFAQIMTLGPGVFDGFGDAGAQWGFYFDRCGLPETPGFQPLVGGSDGSGSGASVAQLSHNCALVASGHGNIDGDYSVEFSGPSTSGVDGGVQLDAPFQVAYAYPNGTLTGNYDAWGLGTWMVRLSLSTSAGADLPMGTPACYGWVPTLTDCAGNSSGWYAVLASPTGEWLGAYGAQSQGINWTQAVWTVVSHQELVIVVPAGWDVTGDVLRLSSTVNASVIRGSLVL